MESVLILSKWNAGGVALAAEQLRRRGLNSVLLSELPDNRNRDRCDAHILVNWDVEDLSDLVKQLDDRDINPVAIVNLIEPLITWQDALSKHYALPGNGPGLPTLADKVLVRERMRELGLSTIDFSADPTEVDFFPAVVKPSRESMASRLVRRVNDPDELRSYLRHLNERGFAYTELIVEEYLPGIEFSVDGPVVDGRFHPVLAVEKPDHDDVRHHDAGLRIYPPQSDPVCAGASVLSERIGALCADLDLDRLWLHVEGRVDADGRTELVEINPRFGGGMYPAAIREACGIDPMEAVVAMALGEFTLESSGPVRDDMMLGWVDVEAEETGRVQINVTEEYLCRLSGVIEAEVVNGYQASDLEKENYFLRFLMEADSVGQLRVRAKNVLDEVEYRMVEDRVLNVV